jgi:hypothetical protein
MKKIYLTLFLLLFSTSAFAFDVCEHEKKYSQIWYYNNCDGTSKKESKKESEKGKLYTSTSKNELPEWANPTDKVLKYYAKKYSKHSKTRKGFKFKIKASENFRKFNFNLRTDDYVNQQLKDTALLSYLVFENDTIVQDEITPEDRFGKYFKNDTKWQSMSMGKSIISYIAGHAICRGYISGINETLDWDIFDNTLYEGQKLINVLNMSSGSRAYKDVQGFKNSKRWVNNPTTQSVMKKELKNSKAGDIRYNYSNMDTNVVASYVLYKMGQDNFVKLLNEIFVNKVGIEHDIFLFKQEDAKKKTPSLTYAFYITRYDFLRIAVAILEDWENDTCEGKYLKSLWEKRIGLISNNILEMTMMVLQTLNNMEVNFIWVFQAREMFLYSSWTVLVVKQ